jgi:succinate dehydrogenase / fumarate reductase, iron-sulfur subunit
MTKNLNFIEVDIITVRDGKEKKITFIYNKREEKEKPMALDVLMQAQSTTIPDLAFRYGCRARNCGVCTIDINNRPRVACRARVKDGDKMSAIATLPVLSDLVVRRDGIARQMRGLQTSGRGNDLNVEAPDIYHELTACIECYACLDKCPMHARNFNNNLPADMGDTLSNASEGYKHGNPFSLLKLARLRHDPLTSEHGKDVALQKAIDLGLDACVECSGCKCGVGIDLKNKVVKPLLEAAKDKL